jgi:hypothetical protein
MLKGPKYHMCQRCSPVLLVLHMHEMHKIRVTGEIVYVRLFHSLTNSADLDKIWYG